MKTFLLTLFLLSCFTAEIIGQNLNQNSRYREIQKFINNEDWKGMYSFLKSDVEMKNEGSTFCQTDPVERLIFGHSCMVMKQWNTAMDCFYCPVDSVNSSALVAYHDFVIHCLKEKDNSASNFLVGDSYARMEKYDSASIYFDKAIEKSSTNILALNARAVNNWIKSKIDKQPACLQCTDDWNKVISIDPSFADAYVSKGVSRIMTGNYTQPSEILLTEAIKIDPEYSLANNGLKVIYHKTNPEKYAEYAKKSKNCPFSKVDEFILMYDSLMSIPENQEKYSRIIDSLNVARGAQVAMTAANFAVSPQLKIAAYATAATLGGASVALHAMDVASTYKQPKISATPQTNYKSWADALGRGGVYSYQIEGQNKKTNREGVPSVTGTWFLLNYPATSFFIENQ